MNWRGYSVSFRVGTWLKNRQSPQFPTTKVSLTSSDAVTVTDGGPPEDGGGEASSVEETGRCSPLPLLCGENGGTSLSLRGEPGTPRGLPSDLMESFPLLWGVVGRGGRGRLSGEEDLWNMLLRFDRFRSTVPSRLSPKPALPWFPAATVSTQIGLIEP
jgi:hypothetical protein